MIGREEGSWRRRRRRRRRIFHGGDGEEREIEIGILMELLRKIWRERERESLCVIWFVQIMV